METATATSDIPNEEVEGMEAVQEAESASGSFIKGFDMCCANLLESCECTFAPAIDSVDRTLCNLGMLEAPEFCCMMPNQLCESVDDS